MPARPKRPVGQPTRGKTALNRLRQIDSFISVTLPEILHGGVPLVVDLGFGAWAWTTLEMRQRWLRHNSALRVLGIEIESERVAAALPFADPPRVDFKVGGFNIADLTGQGHVRLIRCYNVLRQYDEAAVEPSLLTMAQALEEGGLLIEGTSTPSGRYVAFDLYRRLSDELYHSGLVFGTNFNEPVDPRTFQTILPKRLIHHMNDVTPEGFFERWAAAYEMARGQGFKGRGQWMAAAKLLRSRFGYPIDLRPRLIRRGYVTLYTSLSSLTQLHLSD